MKDIHARKPVNKMAALVTSVGPEPLEEEERLNIKYAMRDVEKRRKLLWKPLGIVNQNQARKLKERAARNGKDSADLREFIALGVRHQELQKTLSEMKAAPKTLADLEETLAYHKRRVAEVSAEIVAHKKALESID